MLLLTKNNETESLPVQQSEGLPQISAPHCASLYMRAMELLRQHVADRVGLKDILAPLEVSHYILMRLFLDHLGRTPNQELLRLRLEHAKSLLVNTNLPVNKIAQMCGYPRPSNFGDFICRHTSLTPLSYRRRHSCVGRAVARIPSRERALSIMAHDESV